MFELRDPVASATHLFTAFWALFATLLMWRLTPNDRIRRISVTIFGVSMVVLYAASGTFHGVQSNLRFFQKVDQSAVYTLIAGTCTPLMLMLLSGVYRNVMLAGTWLMAIVGIACLWFLPKAPHPLMVSLYLGMGWFGFSGVWKYYQAIGFWGMLWIVGGAAFYTLGAVFELTRWPVIVPGVIQAHEVLHLTDMVATYCFFVCIVRYVIPYRSPEANTPQGGRLAAATVLAA